MTSGWRLVNPSEPFEPGRRFRMNLGTGETYVWEDNFPVKSALVVSSQLEGSEWREYIGSGGGASNIADGQTYGKSTNGEPSGENTSGGFNFRKDPLADDPQFKSTMEAYYIEHVRKHNEANPDKPIAWSFDEFWSAQTDDVKQQMYKQSKSGYQQYWDDAFKSTGKKAKTSRADTKAQATYDADFQEAVREAVAAGIQVDPNGEMYRFKERYDKQKKEYVYDKIPMGRPSALQLRIMVSQMKAEKATREEQLKDIEAMAKLRPQREAIAGEKMKTAEWVAKQQLGDLKREQAQKRFIDPTKKLLIDPVQEAVVGGFKAMKSTGYGKGSMKMARESFTATPLQGSSPRSTEHPLRPAPRSGFTTPMISRVPERMPVRTTRSGKMIPAGEAITAPAKLVKAAVIAPTAAGSLLTTSVSKMPAASALVPQRPTRLGLSNLRVNIDTSGVRRGGALPRLKIKKNLYNDQLKRIRGLLR